MQRIKIFLRRCFTFRKPVFEELDFIDLIIDDKPLFLVSWRLRYGFKLKIKPLKKTYRSTHDSYVIKLSENLQQVKLVASNLWRRNTRIIQLKHTRMDSKTAALLLQEFRPLNQLTVKNTNIKAIIIAPKLKTIPITIHKSSIHIKKQISLKANRFKYP